MKLNKKILFSNSAPADELHTCSAFGTHALTRASRYGGMQQRSHFYPPTHAR